MGLGQRVPCFFLLFDVMLLNDRVYANNFAIRRWNIESFVVVKLDRENYVVVRLHSTFLFMPLGGANTECGKNGQNWFCPSMAIK